MGFKTGCVNEIRNRLPARPKRPEAERSKKKKDESSSTTVEEESTQSITPDPLTNAYTA